MKLRLLAVSIAVTIASITSPPVQAQSSYSSAQSKTALCRVIGEAGEIGYLEREQGKPREWRGQPGYTQSLSLYAYNYGYDKAVSRKDAHMVGWANCMDKVDRLARESR